MNTTFLLVFRVNGKLYLTLTEDYSLAAYKSEDEIIAAFSEYVRYFKGDFTFRNSAALGMIQAQPIIIVAPELPSDLAKYMVDEKPRIIQGGAIGRGFIGTEVTEDILQLQTKTDVFGTLLQMADN